MTTTAGNTDQAASIKLDVTVRRNPGSHKSRRYTASYGEWPRDIEAEGSTAAEAKANLTAALATAIATIRDARATFARDDDGAMWAAFPTHDGGARHYRVTDENAWGGTTSSRPAAEAFAGCYHMTVIPNR